MKSVREKLLEALSKPNPVTSYDVGDPDYFDPWEDIMPNIYGGYISEADKLFIKMMKALRDNQQFEIIKEYGFSAQLVSLILAGHGMTEYGGSPLAAWVAPEIEDLWDTLIEKWESYSNLMWGRNDD